MDSLLSTLRIQFNPVACQEIKIGYVISKWGAKFKDRKEGLKIVLRISRLSISVPAE